jgi:hypothetical protein
MNRFNGYALEGDQIGHVGTEKRVTAEKHGNDGQGRTDDPPGCFQQQDHQGRPHDQVPEDRGTVSGDEPVIIQCDIQCRNGGDDADGKIEKGNPVRGGKVVDAEFGSLEQRVVQVNEQQGKAQVDGADECGIDDQPTGDGQLEKTPADGNDRNHPFGPSLGPTPHPLFFFRHAPGDLQTVILLVHCLFSHRYHPPSSSEKRFPFKPIRHGFVWTGGNTPGAGSPRVSAGRESESIRHMPGPAACETDRRPAC